MGAAAPMDSALSDDGEVPCLESRKVRRELVQALCPQAGIVKLDERPRSLLCNLSRVASFC